jgi:hypothetical protein
MKEQEKDIIVKKFALAAAFALTLGGAQAAVLEIVSDGSFSNGQAVAARHIGSAGFAVLSSNEMVAPATGMSELPEPEVFAMMLVGLVLIGYRASRDSGEKFE